MASGRLPSQARLAFFVRGNTAVAAAAAGAGPQANAAAAAAAHQPEATLSRIEALLPARGSLAPLLHAFGLLSDAELQREDQDSRAGEWGPTFDPAPGNASLLSQRRVRLPHAHPPSADALHVTAMLEVFDAAQQPRAAQRWCRDLDFVARQTVVDICCRTSMTPNGPPS